MTNKGWQRKLLKQIRIICFKLTISPKALKSVRCGSQSSVVCFHVCLCVRMVDAVLHGKKTVSSPSLCPTSQDVGFALISLGTPDPGQEKYILIWRNSTTHWAPCYRLQSHPGKNLCRKELHVMTVLEHHTEIELRLTALLSNCNLKKEIYRLTTQWRRHLINHQWLLRGCVHLLICMKVWPIAAASAVGSQFLCVCVCAPEGKCRTVIHCFTARPRILYVLIYCL